MMLRRVHTGARLLLALLFVVGCSKGRVGVHGSDARVLAKSALDERTAALLLIGSAGTAKVVCLPDPQHQHVLDPQFKIAAVLDARYKNGRVLVVGRVERLTGDVADLALFVEGTPARVLGKVGGEARFSPDASALLFQASTSERNHSGAYVLDWASGERDDLGDVEAPVWESDGMHVRAFRRLGDAAGRATTSMRMRWDRSTKTWSQVGPGAAQVPAPFGSAMAWSADPMGSAGRPSCAVRIAARGHQHPIVGPFCNGIADDRSVRWSPDGRWLAFVRPGPNLGGGKQAAFFVDVVGIEGGRHPDLSALIAAVETEQLGVRPGPGALWMDWSPSQRYLVLEDGAGVVRQYDLKARTVSFFGVGHHPTFSPGDNYLLLLATPPAFLLDGGPPPQESGDNSARSVLVRSTSSGASVVLEPARDARWLSAEACADLGGRDHPARVDAH
jgi:WD40-like Beta Propeller Repeat